MTGSSNVGVYGAMNSNFDWHQSDSALGLRPNVSCWLDGVVMQSIQLPSGGQDHESYNENNILTCHTNNVNSSNSGEHELFISTSISPKSIGWLLDYIVFESMVNPNLDGEILQAGNVQVGNATNYSMLTFGPG